MQKIIDNPNNIYSNGTYSVIINPALVVGTFYLRVSYQDISFSGTINIHMHNYSYTWVSYIQHRQSCNCGVTGLKSHVVSSESYNSGQMYAKCLLCGGDALISNYNKSFISYTVTFNESFMLPNGVIVITDKDLNSFLDDTFVFNHYNEEKRESIISLSNLKRKYNYMNSIK